MEENFLYKVLECMFSIMEVLECMFSIMRGGWVFCCFVLLVIFIVLKGLYGNIFYFNKGLNVYIIVWSVFFG